MKNKIMAMYLTLIMLILAFLLTFSINYKQKDIASISTIKEINNKFSLSKLVNEMNCNNFIIQNIKQNNDAMRNNVDINCKYNKDFENLMFDYKLLKKEEKNINLSNLEISSKNSDINCKMTLYIRNNP